MVKMNKEYSDAFGFKLLGHFTSFLTQYPDKATTIQKIVDDDFQATCIKCYPIIISTGVDPAKYIPPSLATNTTSIRNSLREMFPVKTQVIDLELASNCSDEAIIETEHLNEDVTTTPLSLQKPATPPRNIKYAKEPLLSSVNLSCVRCSQLESTVKTLKAQYETCFQDGKKILSENQHLRQTLSKKEYEFNRVKKQLDTITTEYNKLIKDTRLIRDDPSYPEIMQYFEYLSSKRKRQQ